MNILNTEDVIVPMVEQVMSFVAKDQANYIQPHKSEFKNEEKEKAYMRDWVANYEISHWMKRGIGGVESQHNLMQGKTSRTIHFDWQIECDVNNTAHEERRRLDNGEEKPFAHLPFFMECCPRHENGATGLPPAVVENNAERSTLLMTPTEWVAHNLQNDSSGDDIKDCIFIVDLTGHFAVMKPVVITDDSSG